jgi:hypothetical protein
MSTLTFRLFISASLLAGLAGCGGDNSSPAPVESDETTQASSDGKIECALAASNSFERVCSTEQISANGSIMLVIRHPDGGFRRFNILTDGRGLAPADGFDQTRINLLHEDMIELSSGDDKYRLPALIRTDVADDRPGKAKDAS